MAVLDVRRIARPRAGRSSHPAVAAGPGHQSKSAEADADGSARFGLPGAGARLEAIGPGAPLVPAQIRFLQARIGNQAVQRLLSAGSIGPSRIQRDGTGIAADEAAGQYVGEASSVISDLEWNRRNPKQRAQDLITLASRRLEALGMPRITGTLGFNLSGGTYAAFIPAVWFIQVADSMVTDDRTPEGRARLVAAVYHEARHAEQYYRVAAMLARDAGKDAGTIQGELKLASNIAQAAAKDGAEQAQRKQPKKGTAQADEAERRRKEEAGWHQAMMLYQAMSEEKKKIDDEYDAAKQDFRRDPTDEKILARYRRAWDQRRQAYVMYQKTAVEADAWGIQGQVEKMLGFTANTLETELEGMARREPDPRQARPVEAESTEKPVGVPSVALGAYLTPPTIQSPKPTSASPTSPSPTGLGGQGRKQRIIAPVQSLITNTPSPSSPTTNTPSLVSTTSPSPTPTGMGGQGRRQRVIPPVQSLITNTPSPSNPTTNAPPSSATGLPKDLDDLETLHLKRIQRHSMPPELEEAVADAKQEQAGGKGPDEDRR